MSKELDCPLIDTDNTCLIRPELECNRRTDQCLIYARIEKAVKIISATTTVEILNQVENPIGRR